MGRVGTVFGDIQKGGVLSELAMTHMLSTLVIILWSSQRRPELKKKPDDESLSVIVDICSAAMEPAASDLPGPILAMLPIARRPADAEMDWGP